MARKGATSVAAERPKAGGRWYRLDDGRLVDEQTFEASGGRKDGEKAGENRT